MGLKTVASPSNPDLEAIRVSHNRERLGFEIMFFVLNYNSSTSRHREVELVPLRPEMKSSTFSLNQSVKSSIIRREINEKTAKNNHGQNVENHSFGFVTP